MLDGLCKFSALLLIVWYIQRLQWDRRRRGFPLPPGPKPLPVIGNLLDLEHVKHPWLVYQKWAEKYGDMIFLRIVQTPMLIINSSDIAYDLMEKRSAIYSDKPTMASDQLTGWDYNAAFMPYGPWWRSVRRQVHQYFNQFATLKYRKKQRREVHALLRRLLDSQQTSFDPITVRQALSAVIMDVVYAYKISSMDDEYIRIASEAVDVIVTSRTPGMFWVDYIPFIKYIPAWVPGAAATKFGARTKPLVLKMFNQPFDVAKERASSEDSVVANLLKTLDHVEDDNLKRDLELQARQATGIAFAAGADTTFSVLTTFFCVMAMHPEIQAKAQKELEEVVGPDRLPEYEDFDTLPYIQAILTECLRWLPVLPLGLPHQALVDDFYRDYFIPKGTIIMANVWAMTHDPKDYPDPNTFNPDRWLKDGKFNRDVRDPMMVFGFGRRICPGRYFAKDNAFLTIASVLHIFNIVPSLDENGNPVDPSFEPTTGTISLPDRVRCMVKPRSKAAELLVKELLVDY